MEIDARSNYGDLGCQYLNVVPVMDPIASDTAEGLSFTAQHNSTKFTFPIDERLGRKPTDDPRNNRNS